MKLMRRILVAPTVAAALLALAGCGASGTSTAAAPAEPARNEILWDRYGVPHVYGTSTAAVFHGYGYAQAQSHGDEILRLYGESRARGAEYWGAKYEDTAVWLVKNDVPGRSKSWYDAQAPAFKATLSTSQIRILLPQSMRFFSGEAVRIALEPGVRAVEERQPSWH